MLAIECVARSCKAEEWGGGREALLQTGDVVEEIKIGNSPAVQSPFASRFDAQKSNLISDSPIGTMGPTADEEEAENGSGRGGIAVVETVTRAVAKIAGLPESGWAVVEALLRPRPAGEAPQPALRRAQGRRWRRLPWRIPDPKHGALLTILERHLKVKAKRKIGSERSGDGSRRSGAKDGETGAGDRERKIRRWEQEIGSGRRERDGLIISFSFPTKLVSSLCRRWTLYIWIEKFSLLVIPRLQY